MKKVRKMLPVSIADISGLENWLEEQANQGLFPVRNGSWATFTPTGVPGTRFRIEPYGKSSDAPTEEQLALYRNAGWEYAFAIGSSYYFLFYTTDPSQRILRPLSSIPTVRPAASPLNGWKRRPGSSGGKGS